MRTQSIWTTKIFILRTSKKLFHRFKPNARDRFEDHAQSPFEVFRVILPKLQETIPADDFFYPNFGEALLCLDALSRGLTWADTFVPWELQSSAFQTKQMCSDPPPTRSKGDSQNFQSSSSRKQQISSGPHWGSGSLICDMLFDGLFGYPLRNFLGESQVSSAAL